MNMQEIISLREAEIHSLKRKIQLLEEQVHTQNRVIKSYYNRYNDWKDKNTCPYESTQHGDK